MNILDILLIVIFIVYIFIGLVALFDNNFGYLDNYIKDIK